MERLAEARGKRRRLKGDAALHLLQPVEEAVDIAQELLVGEDALALCRAHVLDHALQAAAAVPLVDGRCVDDVERFAVHRRREIGAIPHQARDGRFVRAELEAQMRLIAADGHGLAAAHIAAAEVRLRVAHAVRLEQRELLDEVECQLLWHHLELDRDFRLVVLF